MNPHTPGPWLIRDGSPRIVYVEHFPVVAPWDADALLIAAAPDLLAALKDLEEAWAHVRIMPCDGRSHRPDATEECEECGNASALSKRTEAARAAIAKAEGR